MPWKEIYLRVCLGRLAAHDKLWWWRTPPPISWVLDSPLSEITIVLLLILVLMEMVMDKWSCTTQQMSEKTNALTVQYEVQFRFSCVQMMYKWTVQHKMQTRGNVKNFPSMPEITIVLMKDDGNFVDAGSLHRQYIDKYFLCYILLKLYYI